MGRCGWGVGVALVLAVLGASCGGTGGGPSDSGSQFVFTARGRLNLAVQAVSTSGVQIASATQAAVGSKQLVLTATLLDPQGVPFRNQPITFTAEFLDATFIPGNDNKGSVLTDDSGQASITLIAGLTIGKMRVTAEAPPALNISTSITVTLTEQGFVSIGTLSIIPSSVTFVNPAPHPSGGPSDFIFQATGGDPPYKFSNSNPSVGKVETTGLFGSLGQYTLTGPLPIAADDARKDTVTVQDAKGDRVTATVSVIFADCLLHADGTSFNVLGLPGRNFQVNVADGVPPFTVTSGFPGSVNVDIVVLDQKGNFITGEACDKAGENCVIRFSLADPVRNVDGLILIRDSRGCTATVTYHVIPVSGPTVTTIVLEANPTSINGVTGGTSAITATVLDENNHPIPGVSVLFTDDSARATTDPLTATTNSSGRAFSTLKVPPLTPTAKVMVFGSAQEKTSVPVVVTIVAQGGPAGPPANIAVDLFTGQSGDNNDGTCTAILSALVVDAKGNPVDDGTRVDLAASLATTTTGGTVAVAVTSPAFTNQLPPCDLSSFQNIKITPQPGDALACLKYPRSASGGKTTITATAGGIPPRSFTVTLPACPFVPSGGLAISPSSVTLAPGESRTFIVVGGIPPYTIAASGGTLNTNQVAASGGSFTYTAGSQTGDFAIFATDSAGKQDQATVTITAESAKVTKIILAATPPSVNGVTGGTSTITAAVLNSNNQPIPNASVFFSTTIGTISPLPVVTGSNGQATATLTILAGTPAGVATVSASAGGVTGSVDVSIFTPSSGPAGPPANIFVDLFANRSGDNNDGTCTTIVSALVVDAAGNPVNDGTRVDWSIQAGNASVTSPSFTNQLPSPPSCRSTYEHDSGLAITPQPGDALTCLKYPQKESGNIVTVRATATAVPSVFADLPLNLPPCPTSVTITLVASTASLGAGGQSVITATVRGANNQPVNKATVIFSTTGGTLSSTMVTTNVSGQATTTLTAPGTKGSVTVTGTVQVNGISIGVGTVVVTVS